ncbi:MAG: hypothetical protein LBQ52_01905 [Helicobacteraceae bacterium]|jgi:hypothetical protein|nr:hypothetical protein [Helicobacteraceae bacterium]
MSESPHTHHLDTTGLDKRLADLLAREKNDKANKLTTEKPIEPQEKDKQ